MVQATAAPSISIALILAMALEMPSQSHRQTFSPSLLIEGFVSIQKSLQGAHQIVDEIRQTRRAGWSVSA